MIMYERLLGSCMREEKDARGLTLQPPRSSGGVVAYPVALVAFVALLAAPVAAVSSRPV